MSAVEKTIDQLVDEPRLAVKPEFIAFGRPDLGDEEVAAVSRVIRSGWIGMGPETIEFEKELETYVQAPHVVTVNSCTSALFLSLLVSDVKQGDEVICPSLTWCSTANAILYLGAKPVFCDVDIDTLCVSAETVIPHITSKTKAIVVVHFGGLAVDVEKLRQRIPDRITIVEDAAHALGAQYSNRKPVGSSGNLTCFSFYANKNLSTGDGGAIALNDGDVAERLRSLRQHGLATDAWKRFIDPQKTLVPGIQELGFKMNYTDLQAALGRVQLKRQPELQNKRLSIAHHYVEALKDMSFCLKFQTNILGVVHARHLFVIKMALGNYNMTRNELLLVLRARNIGVSVHYSPLHLMPYYKGMCKVRLENTENIADSLMTLPIGASMNSSDVDYVIENLINVINVPFSEKS